MIIVYLFKWIIWHSRIEFWSDNPLYQYIIAWMYQLRLFVVDQFSKLTLRTFVTGKQTERWSKFKKSLVLLFKINTQLCTMYTVSKLREKICFFIKEPLANSIWLSFIMHKSLQTTLLAHYANFSSANRSWATEISLVWIFKIIIH